MAEFIRDTTIPKYWWKNNDVSFIPGGIFRGLAETIYNHPDSYYPELSQKILKSWYDRHGIIFHGIP